MNMHLDPTGFGDNPMIEDSWIGRIVSVTGSKAIVLLDNHKLASIDQAHNRPEMGTLLGLDTDKSISLGLVSALSVPVPAQRDDDSEIWIAELSLVGELVKDADGVPSKFNRGVSTYPSLGALARLATKDELAKAFSTAGEHAVCVGAIRQDASIPAMVKTDDLLGKHFAILGTTGTGKSCTTALILRAILEKNPAAHLVLLDPHNEYSNCFGDMAEVITPRNMELPHWLLTFEELVEVLIGDPTDRKQEVEMLQELVPICKDKYGSASRGQQGKLSRSGMSSGRYTVDTPVPWRINDLVSLIDERMGRLENKRDLAPFRALKTRIDTITKDQRYAFMFGGITVDDIMADVLGRIFRVPVNDRPITIMELTGLPTEIVNVVVSVLCRMTFDFALWGDGRVPVTIVCEEAHRYVPGGDAAKGAFEPARRAIAKIAKEGRKYGASLCVITQRPSEIDPTILSQCNTVFALRMSNDRDQEIVRSAISDTGSGLLEFLPALGAREAIAFGDGVSLPVRIKFHELPKEALPKSDTAKFSEKWQKATDDMDLMHMVVERWRASGASETEEATEEGGYATNQPMQHSAMPSTSEDFARSMSQEPSPVIDYTPEAPQQTNVDVEEAAPARPRLRRREPEAETGGTEGGLRARLLRRDGSQTPTE